jgi:hypothetical protein
MAMVVSDPADAEFITSFKTHDLFQVILAANYMDIKSLLHLGCAMVASKIKGKSPEEIRKALTDDDAAPGKLEAEAAAGDVKADK